MKVYPVKPYFLKEDIFEILADAEKILGSGMITTHAYTKRFEENFAKIHGVEHAIAVGTGSAALDLAIQCTEIEKPEILVPTNTFTATIAPILRNGYKPVLTDVDPETLCMDIDSVQEKITNKTGAILVVHIGGLICPEITEIKRICDDNELKLIEDAAHAHGSVKHNKHAGSYGDAGCFSLYATKIITTGEGGIVTTNDEEIAEKVYILRDQGKNPENADEIVRLGGSYRFPEISAALGIAQLERLGEIIQNRMRVAAYYSDELKHVSGVTSQPIPRDSITGYYKHVSFLDDNIDRIVLKSKLREKGVYCGGEVYAIPIHLQPIYKELLDTKKGDFPNAEYACSHMLCLPLNAWMQEGEMVYVINSLKETLEEI